MTRDDLARDAAAKLKEAGIPFTGPTDFLSGFWGVRIVVLNKYARRAEKALGFKLNKYYKEAWCKEWF